MNTTFLKLIASSNPFIWVDSFEYDRAILNLSNVIEEKVKERIFERTEISIWDADNGIKGLHSDSSNNNEKNPLQPIEYLKKGKNKIVFVLDYDNFIKEVMVWRSLLNSLEYFKSQSNTFVIISPNPQSMPENVKRFCSVVDFELPQKEELMYKLNELITTVREKDNMPLALTDKEKENIVNSGLGLSLYEFENAISYSLSESGKILPQSVYNQKEQLIKVQSSLEVCKFDKNFEAVIGLDNLKVFTKRMVLSGKGRGIIEVGQPGAGKSLFAKCLGNETGRITICLNFESLMGSLVGESEAKMKAALQIVDSMAPCILFIDEIEKGLSGMTGANGDSGTSKRQGGMFLKWLSDHKSDVFVIATSNDISALPDEFLRAERWDSLFFIDFPNADERKKLVDMYKKVYDITEENENIDYTDWTGAEIKSLCRIASSLDISLNDAKEYVTHVSIYAPEKVNSLRTWAKGRTIPASKEMITAKPIISDNYLGGRKISVIK